MEKEDCDFWKKRSFFEIYTGFFTKTEIVLCDVVPITNTERAKST